MSHSSGTQFDEIESLQAQVAKLVQAIDKQMVVTHLGVFNQGDDPDAAIHKLMCWSQTVGEYFAKETIAKLTEERDEWKHEFKACYARLTPELTAATARIAELESALEFECGNRCNAEYNPCNAREVLNCKSNLDAYSSAIDECMSVIKHDCDCGMPCDCFGPSTARNQIRALKKGKV